MLRVKLVKSMIGGTPRNRATVRALGLRKTQQTVEHDDNPVIRGMIHHVKHLLTVEVVEGSPTKTKVRPSKKRAPVKAAYETKPRTEKKEAPAKPKAVKATATKEKSAPKAKKPAAKATTKKSAPKKEKK